MVHKKTKVQKLITNRLATKKILQKRSLISYVKPKLLLCYIQFEYINAEFWQNGCIKGTSGH